MTFARLLGVGAGLGLLLAGCGSGQPGAEPSPTLSLDYAQMEKQRIEASQRAEARASASPTPSSTPAGPYVWKEIPEPTMPPEALTQAGFTEAELAAKYFVELELYVRQTNDLETWGQVIHPESQDAQEVITRAHEQQNKRTRLGYTNLKVDSKQAEVGVENENIFRVQLTISADSEFAVSENGQIVAENGPIRYQVETFMEYVGDAWRLIGSDYRAFELKEQ